MTDEKCPGCGKMSFFETIYGWWKCRQCFATTIHYRPDKYSEFKENSEQAEKKTDV